MASGNVAIRIGEDPVVLQRTPDGAAFLMELAQAVVADEYAGFR
ncbi:MAG: hypothetical protein P8Y01_04770 [Woeseiaceae bacterium]